jgi:hypothetical protein
MTVLPALDLGVGPSHRLRGDAEVPNALIMAKDHPVTGLPNRHLAAF